MSVPRCFEFFIISFVETFLFLFLLNSFKKIKKIATCQALIVPCGSDIVMWQ